MTERNRELLALIPAALLVTAGFAAVFVQRDDVLTNVSLTYGGIFLGLCVVAHLIVRVWIPIVRIARHRIDTHARSDVRRLRQSC